MNLTIYTDGASRGNPGPASYGFVVKDESGHTRYKEGKCLGVNTNNFAEYSAILAAISYVKDNFKDAVDISLNFLMDSKLAVEQLSGRFKVKNQTLRDFHGQIIRSTLTFSKVTFKHIPRALNSEADEQANIALDSLSPE